MVDRGIGSSLEHLMQGVCERGNSERPQKRKYLTQGYQRSRYFMSSGGPTFENFALVHRERVDREPPEGFRNNQLR